MIIDTKNKTIKFDESETMGDVISELKVIFPKGEWKEYKLEVNNIEINYPSYPNNPWVQPYTTPYTTPFYYGGWSVTNDCTTTA